LNKKKCLKLLKYGLTCRFFLLWLDFARTKQTKIYDRRFKKKRIHVFEACQVHADEILESSIPLLWSTSRNKVVADRKSSWPPNVIIVKFSGWQVTRINLFKLWNLLNFYLFEVGVNLQCSKKFISQMHVSIVNN